MRSALLRLLAVRGGVSHGPRLHVGLGTVLWAPRSLIIGRDVYIGKMCTVEVDGVIGDGTLIANNVGIVGRRDHEFRQVGIEARNARWVGDHPAQLSDPVTIGSDVWIGYGSIVLSGITIGDSAIVGAGSLVTSDVAANTVVAGRPAKPVGKRFSANELRLHWEGLAGRGISPVTGGADT